MAAFSLRSQFVIRFTLKVLVDCGRYYLTICAGSICPALPSLALK